jgi:predicted O-methyltransferase YrrM
MSETPRVGHPVEVAQNGVAAEPGIEEARHVGKLLPRLVWSSRYQSDYFPLWEQMGFHISPVHYYSPIPDTRALRPELWERESPLVGISMKDEAQLDLLQQAFPRYQDEYNQLPMEQTPSPHEFHFGNPMFSGTDALVLYCMVRHFRPALVLEVGSGFSSRLSAQAALKNGDTKLVCIEPYPEETLRQGFPGLTALHEKRVQDVDLEFFEQLSSNDILFVDSSHVVKIGGDVTYLFLEVFPRLKPGVLVHVHDIYLPAEVRRDWVLEELRFWNEQYLLHAFLLFNSAFEVLFANNYLALKYPEEMRRTFPRSPWWGGGSFWIRRKLDGDTGRP